jgi:phosphoglycerate dehydrogenase-like enzyme
MRRIKSLLIPDEPFYIPWCQDIIDIVSQDHDLAVLDENQPLQDQFEGVEVVVEQGGQNGTPEMVELSTKAKMWQVTTVGFEHVDVEHFKRVGIPLANTPGTFSAPALAEVAFMMMLMLAHRYVEGTANIRQGVRYGPMGRELDGLTLGIIGFGSSGVELAKRAKGFGMKIKGIDIQPIAQEILDEIQPEFIGDPEDADQVISDSDFLSLHLHLNEETSKYIDSRRFGLMKQTACLINVARGGLVDEPALLKALQSGEIGGAGLDVFDPEPPDPDSPLLRLPNVVATPHIAGVTRETSRRRAECVKENVDRIAQGMEPIYRIDQ